MFLFKNTKSKVKRIGMNMAVYGFAGVFVLMILTLVLPKIFADYIYVLTVISSFAAIIGSIISIVRFVYELTPYAINKQTYIDSMKEYRINTNRNVDTNNLKDSITILVEYLKNNKYDIDFSAKELTIVKQSDDPWNIFDKFIAKADGVYNYVEVQMGGYAEKKRVSCCDFETACFLTISMFVSGEKPSIQEALLLEIKKHADYVVENSSDYWRGQFIIDEFISLVK